MKEFLISIFIGIVVGVLIYFVTYMDNRGKEIYLHSSPYLCSRVYGTETKDYALCVYELPRGIRKQP